MADRKKLSKPAKKSGGWYPGKNIKKAVKKVAAGIKKRKTKRQIKKNAKKINKRAIKLEKKTPGAGLDYVKVPKNVNPAKIKATGKIRKKSTSVTMTEGGAYATYKKKSKAAKSFRSSFAAASKAGKKTFTWDGRSYSTKKAPAKKKK